MTDYNHRFLHSYKLRYGEDCRRIAEQNPRMALEYELEGLLNRQIHSSRRKHANSKYVR